MTLEEALRMLDENSLDLRLAHTDLAAAEARITTAGSRTNPSLSATREQLAGNGRTYDETTLSLSQTVEMGGQRRLRIEAAEQSREAVAAELYAERLRLAFEVRRRYVLAAAAERSLATLEETAAVFRRVDEAGRRRLDEGDISEFERRRLQVERIRYENLLADARIEVLRAGRGLALLVAPESLREEGLILLPIDSLEQTALPMTFPSLDSALAALSSRAEIRAAESDIGAARALVLLQGRERIPDLTVSGGVKDQADGMRGPTVSLTIPIPVLDRNTGRMAEAEAALAHAEARFQLVRMRAEADIRLAWEHLRALALQLELLNSTRQTPSRDLLPMALVAYDEGEISLIELLDAADAHRTAGEAGIELLADYIVAFYELERAMGRPGSSE